MSKSYQGQVTAGAGNAEVDFAPPSGYWWYVTHIAVTTNQNADTQCKAFVDQKYFCGTRVGQNDTADGSPLIVNDNQQLRLVWTTPGAGAVCTCNIIVEETLRGYIPQ